jgi:hypothetical protein
VSDNQVPLGYMMVFAILRPKLGTAFQIGGHITVNMPFRMATPATLLDIAGVSLMTHLTECLTLSLGFFTCYQDIQMPHFTNTVDRTNNL